MRVCKPVSSKAYLVSGNGGGGGGGGVPEIAKRREVSEEVFKEDTATVVCLRVAILSLIFSCCRCCCSGARFSAFRFNVAASPGLNLDGRLLCTDGALPSQSGSE